MHGLGRLSSIYIAMWLVPGELWYLVGGRHLTSTDVQVQTRTKGAVMGEREHTVMGEHAIMGEVARPVDQ